MEKDGVIQHVTSAVSAVPIVVVGKKESEDVDVTCNAHADVEAYHQIPKDAQKSQGDLTINTHICYEDQSYF